MTVLKLGGLLVTVVVAYWALLFLMQRRMMYPAPVGYGSGDPPDGVTRVWLEQEGGPTEAWWLAPSSASDSPRPLMVYAHGNGELIDHWPYDFNAPRTWGMAVLLVEYPGYGRSSGAPSERTIAATFRAAHDWAMARDDVDADRIVGYGRSLGGGAITALSRERPLAALILESTFTSTRPFARRRGMPAFLVRDVFDNVRALEAYRGPVMVLHGANDDLVPVTHGRRLAEVAGVVLRELPCGHNDCPRPWPMVREFLLESGIISPQWR